MEDQIRPNNFDQICRLCLEYASHEKVLFPLFINDANIPGFYGRFIKEFKESIPEVLSTCTGIEVRSHRTLFFIGNLWVNVFTKLQIDPSEKLPLNICSVCEKQLIITNEFRRKCWQSNEYLRELRLTDEVVDFDTDGDTLVSFFFFASLPHFLGNRYIGWLVLTQLKMLNVSVTPCRSTLNSSLWTISKMKAKRRMKKWIQFGSTSELKRIQLTCRLLTKNFP